MPWRFLDNHTTVRLHFPSDFADKDIEKNPFNSFTELQKEEEIVHGTPYDQTQHGKNFEFVPTHQFEDNLSEARSEGSMSTDYDSVVFLTCVTFTPGDWGDQQQENRCYILCVNQSGIIRTWNAKTNNSTHTIHLNRFSSCSNLKYQIDWANGISKSPANEKVLVVFRVRKNETSDRSSQLDSSEDCRTDFVAVNSYGIMTVNEDAGARARSIIKCRTNSQRVKHFPQFMLIIDEPSFLSTTYMMILTKTSVICVDIRNFTYDERLMVEFGNIKECLALHNKEESPSALHVHVLRQQEGVFGLKEVIFCVENKILKFCGEEKRIWEQPDLIKIKKMENIPHALLLLTNKLEIKQMRVSPDKTTGSVDLAGCHRDYGSTQRMIYKPTSSEDAKPEKSPDRVGLLFLLFEKPNFFVVEVLKKGEQVYFGKKRVFEVFKKKTFRIRALGMLPVDNCLWLVVKGDRNGLFHIMLMGLPGDLIYDGGKNDFSLKGTVPSCYKGLKCDPVDLRENGFVVGDYRGRIVHVKDTRKIFYLNLEIFKKVMSGHNFNLTQQSY